ncbi:hypothetical protein KEJ27_09295 [Candidatus Bathyarchaeota archaeon]|nr:hypothetical protein [Candidatus Bathyarchaeota archaeon]
MRHYIHSESMDEDGVETSKPLRLEGLAKRLALMYTLSNLMEPESLCFTKTLLATFIILLEAL